MLSAAEVAGYLSTAVTVLIAVAAAFIAWRRLAGALETPLAASQLLATGVLIAGLAKVAHVRFPAMRFTAVSVLISLATLTLALSLSIGGTRSIALLAFWAVLIAEEAWAWRLVSPLARRGRGAGGEGLARLHRPVADDESPQEPANEVLQQLTRRTTAEGGQELTGWLRMPLATGQRTGSLHVAFCPPFAQPPTVEAEAASGPDCRIKMGQVLAHGVRLDVKLEAAAEADESVLLWFYAVTDNS